MRRSPGPDAREHPGLELVVLAAGVERDPPREHGVDLLLLVVGVVVLGVVLEVRRQLDDLDPERGHAEPGADAPHPAAVQGFEVLEALDRYVSHRP